MRVFLGCPQRNQHFCLYGEAPRRRILGSGHSVIEKTDDVLKPYEGIRVKPFEEGQKAEECETLGPCVGAFWEANEVREPLKGIQRWFSNVVS